MKTGWTIAHPFFHGRARPRVVVVAAVAFALYVVFKVPAIDVLLIAAVVGFLLPPVHE